MANSTGRLSRYATLLATAALVAAACTPAASTAPTGAPTAAATAGATEAPFDAVSYPATGTSACGSADYSGQIGLIRAVDAKTVEFTLCAPDASFLSKIAFASLGIQDADYLQTTGGGGDLIRMPNGTGPYKLQSWTSGSDITLVANPDYWGPAPVAKTLIIRWSKEAAQRLIELTSGNVDGIDNIGAEDFTVVEGNPDLQLKARTALNTFYIGMNNTKDYWSNPLVRKAIAEGIDRQRIVDTFYPPGSSAASHFTPCDISGGCEGEAWYAFDPVQAKKDLADAGYPTGFSTKIHLRDVVRSYLPTPVDVATDIQAQLKANLNITAEIDVQDPTTYLTTASRGELEGLFLLGWGADYPDMTNFLDVFFGVGADDGFGTKWDDITGPISSGGQTADPEARKGFYATANDKIREHIPMVPVAHGGSGVAYRADVQGAHSSPIGNEYFAAMTPGSREQFVWMQNGEPGGLYCGDVTDGESLRVCEQINESLYSYEVGGTDPKPQLATCTANADSTVWTCVLRDGVKFHNGATLDSLDVLTTYAMEWDAGHPLHVGQEGLFEYWSYLFADYLNKPAS